MSEANINSTKASLVSSDSRENMSKVDNDVARLEAFLSHPGLNNISTGDDDDVNKLLEHLNNADGVAKDLEQKLDGILEKLDGMLNSMDAEGSESAVGSTNQSSATLTDEP